MGEVSFFVAWKPVSTNATYLRSAQKRLRKSDAAKAFTGAIQVAARRAMRGAPMLTRRVHVELVMVFQDERPDTDGPLKPVLDAMAGIVYPNDRKARKQSLDTAICKARPGVLVRVRELEGDVARVSGPEELASFWADSVRL